MTAANCTRPRHTSKNPILPRDFAPHIELRIGSLHSHQPSHRLSTPRTWYAMCFDTLSTTKEYGHGVSTTGGVREKGHRRRRGKSLHGDEGHADPSLYGGRDPCPGGGLCCHHQPDHRAAAGRRPVVPRRLLHALSARLRPADGRGGADAAGAARPAARRHRRRRVAELGAGFHRQFRRRPDRRRHDGHCLHLRLRHRTQARSAS